ncbi:MAG TPA: DUF2085 domain-containing protein [Chloroflexi bacterium]|nr:DUF2085 domain-containing protein [Chloroflexota bacterium]
MFLDIARWLLSGVCHQLPEHALVVGGQALPLCARCTGTFLGVPVGLLALWASGQGRRSGMPRGRVWIALVLPVVAWMLDGANAFVGDLLGRVWLYTPHNVLRLVTGTGFGLVLAVLLYPTIHYALAPEAGDEPVLARPRDGLVLPLAGALQVATLQVATIAPYGVWAIALAAATTGVLTVVNALLIILALNREGTAQRWSSVALYGVAGLGAALAETGTLALVRRLVVG